MIKYIKMQRGDKFADVHPAEVQNYKMGGYAVVDTKRKEEAVIEEAPKDILYDVYKVTGGKRGTRASRANLSKEEAEAWANARDDDYLIVAAD